LFFFFFANGVDARGVGAIGAAGGKLYCNLERKSQQLEEFSQLPRSWHCIYVSAGMSAGLVGWGAGIGVPTFFFVLIFCCLCLWCIRQRRYKLNDQQKFNHESIQPYKLKQT